MVAVASVLSGLSLPRREAAVDISVVLEPMRASQSTEKNLRELRHLSRIASVAAARLGERRRPPCDPWRLRRVARRRT
jgi:hypothetical protein